MYSQPNLHCHVKIDLPPPASPRSRLKKLATEFNVAVIVTNHVMSDPSGGMTFVQDPKKPIGELEGGGTDPPHVHAMIDGQVRVRWPFFGHQTTRIPI